MNIVDVDWNMYLKQKGLYCQNEEQSNDESVQVQDNFSAWFRKGLYSLKKSLGRRYSSDSFNYRANPNRLVSIIFDFLCLQIPNNLT